jgi:hypothetical protein
MLFRFCFSCKNVDSLSLSYFVSSSRPPFDGVMESNFWSSQIYGKFRRGEFLIYTVPQQPKFV